MGAGQKDHWYFVVLIFLLLLKVAVQEKEALTVRLEEGMVLECLCPWHGNLALVSWTKIPKKNPIAVFHPEYEVVFSHHYRERIEFLRTTPTDGSISMRNVTHQDIGLYHCSVQMFPQGSWSRSIQVEDLDEPPEEDNSTAPPTPDVIKADMELVAEQGKNLTITCNYEHSGAVDQVVLEKMRHGQPLGLIAACKNKEVDLVGEDYRDRGMVSCTDSLDLSLHLTRVAQQDGGFYRCTFSTDAGVQTTTVLITVPYPGGISLSAYMMYIYIGTGGAGLILLIVIVILAVRHRKRNKREEYRVKLQPSQRPPNLYQNNSVRTKKSRPIKDCPVYVNLQTVESYRTRQLCHK